MDTRERYMVDVVNLPRLPVQELVKQLDELSKLVARGWKIALYDDVPKLCFLVIARSESGLTARAVIPYEYMESIGDASERDVLQAVWDQRNAAEKRLIDCVAALLTKRAAQVTELQDAGVFNGQK